MDSSIGGAVHFIVLFLISAIVKVILERYVRMVKAMKVEVLDDSIFLPMLDVVPGPNNIMKKKPNYLSFSVFDDFGFVEPFVAKSQVDLWNFSKAIYFGTLFSSSNGGLYNSFFRLWSFRVLPFLEKFVPAFLFLGLVEFLLFDATGLFISTVFLLVLLSLFSIILGLTGLPFHSRVKSGVNLNIEQRQRKNFNQSLLLIHFSPFYRCLGLFWRVVYVFKWLFRD
jgi:hypothetical protein